MSPVIAPACDRNVDNAREMGNGSASFLSCAIGSTKQCCPAVLMLRRLSRILLLRAEGSTITTARLLVLRPSLERHLRPQSIDEDNEKQRALGLPISYTLLPSTTHLR